MPNRRHVLELLALAPLGASLGACAGGSDYAGAWRSPGAGEQDPRRFALAHAILAPNPHNMQPWLVELQGTDSLVFSPDLTRLLPVTDPPNRQITIGCGAFLELFDMAAREQGYRSEITLWPQGEPQPNLDARPIAQVRLVKDASVARDPLFAHITARRTNREPFDAGRIPTEAAVQPIAAAAAPLTARYALDTSTVSAIRDLSWRGWTREFATPAANLESVKVMRIGNREIAEHRDGLMLNGPMIEALHAAGVITPKTLMDPNSQASKQGAAMWKKLADTATGFVWLAGADNSRATQIAAGRAYARMNLTATAGGLGMHPWSMALQEYPEMADLYREAQGLLGGATAAPVQMVARIGYGRTVGPTPRRGVAAILKA